MYSCTWLIPAEFNLNHAGFAWLLFFVAFSKSIIKSFTVCDLSIVLTLPPFSYDLLVGLGQDGYLSTAV